MGLADLIIRDTERISRVKGRADGFANGQFQGHVGAFEQEIKKRPELTDMINLKLKRGNYILDKGVPSPYRAIALKCRFHSPFEGGLYV